eukprot:Anaeramoba_ignava/a480690_30.p1 GENE.a480690_30~~a480690_30.p1  ORF type:complete len:1708 (+),score=322.10 a480690_30:310-5433(+)
MKIVKFILLFALIIEFIKTQNCVAFDSPIYELSTTNFTQTNPKGIRLGNGKYAVSWVSNQEDGYGKGIFANIFSYNGERLKSTEFQVNTVVTNDQENQAMALLGNGRFVVTWESQGDTLRQVKAQIFSVDGSKVGNEFQVNSIAQNSQYPQVCAIGEDGFIIVWQGFGQTTTWVYGQIFNSNGEKVGNEINIYNESTTQVINPFVCNIGTQKFIVSWESKISTDNPSQIYAQPFWNNGSKIMDKFQVNSPSGVDNKIPFISTNSAANNTFIISWQRLVSDYEIFAQVFTEDCDKLGGEFLVNSVQQGDQTQSSNAMMPSGQFVIAWEGQDGGTQGVFAKVYNSKRENITSEFALVNNSIQNEQNPEIINFGNNSAVFVWQETDVPNKIMARTLRLAQPPVTLELMDNQIVNSTKTFNFTQQNVFSDSDSPTLTYSATYDNYTTIPPDSSWLMFDPNLLKFFGSAPFTCGATEHIFVFAEDECSFTTSTSFFLTIRNFPPVRMKDIADISWNFNYHEYQVPFDTFVDPEDQTITYTAKLQNGSSIPNWMNITSSGALSVTPPQGEGQTCEYDLFVELSASGSCGFTPYIFRVHLTNSPPVVSTPMSSQTVVVNQPFSFSFSNVFFDNDSSSILQFSSSLSSGGDLPSWISFDPINKQFTGTPNISLCNVSYSLMLQTTDYCSTKRVDFEVAIQNDPLVQNSVIDNVQLYTNGSNFFTIPANIFEDPNGATLQYSMDLANGSALPLWIKFNEPTMGVSITPSASQCSESLTVRLSATDGCYISTTTFIVKVTNRAPLVNVGSFDDQIFEYGVYSQVQFPSSAFTDPESNTLVFSAFLFGGNQLPAWLQFNPLTLLFHTDYMSVGTEICSETIFVDVQAFDGCSTSHYYFTGELINNGPMLNQYLPSRQVPVTNFAVFALPSDLFTDPDSDIILTAKLTNGNALPSWINFFSANRTFVAQPPFQMCASTFEIAVIADDQCAQTNTTFYFEVINKKPTVSRSIPDHYFMFSQSANIAYEKSIFADESPNNLIITAKLVNGSALPQWLNFQTNSTHFYFTGKPPETCHLALEVAVTANDTCQTVTDIFNIFYDNVAPRMVGSIQSPVYDARGFAFSIDKSTFYDPDTSPLTYTIDYLGGTKPAWLSFDAATLTFIATAPNVCDMDLPFRVTASDGCNSVDFSFTITVINNPPFVHTTIQQQTISVNDFSFAISTASFQDPDTASTEFIYTAKLSNGSNLPGWLNFDGSASNPHFYGYLAPNDYYCTGLKLEIAISVSDGCSSATQFFNLSIENDKPIIVATVPDRNFNFTPFNFQIDKNSFRDEDNEALSFTASLDNMDPLPAWINFNTDTLVFSGTPPSEVLCGYSRNITLFVNDNCTTITDTFLFQILSQSPYVNTSIPDMAFNLNPHTYVFPEYTFADGDTATSLLVYSAGQSNGSALPTWLTFTSSSRLFNSTPPKTLCNQTYTIRLNATDDCANVGNDTFKLLMQNDAPYYTSPISRQTIYNGRYFSFTVSSFQDDDTASQLVYSISAESGSYPTWIKFDNTSLRFSGTVPNNQCPNSNYNLILTASDGCTQVPQTVPFKIVNEPPTVVGTIPDFYYKGKSSISYSFESNVFSDIYSISLTYKAQLDDGSPLPSWLQFASDTRTFSGNPNREYSRVLDVMVLAFDECDSSANTTFKMDLHFLASDAFSITNFSYFLLTFLFIFQILF